VPPPQLTVTRTETHVTTVVQTTITKTAPAETTETTGVSPAGAAAVAAAASDDDEGSSTPWGWIAVGILAAAVIVFAIVWLVRRRDASPRVSG
jgi:hypothetical protein